jgi:cytochrome o ubiquinol oxidase subunit IV
MTTPVRSTAGGRALVVLGGLAAAALLARFARDPGPVGPVGEARPVPNDGAAHRAGRPRAEVGEASQARHRHGDTAPGEQTEAGTGVAAGVRSYLIGLALAAALTAGSFALTSTSLVYGPGLGVALVVFALAQVGVHLVFFLHLTTAPDNINNAMALAFGALIVFLLIGGTLWIMTHMNTNMMPTGGMSPSAPMSAPLSAPGAVPAPAPMHHH